MYVADVLPLSPPATSSGSRKRPLPLFASQPPTDTPDDFPASGPEFSSLGSKKKVEFSPWANIHHPAALVHSSLDDTSSVKPLLPSRECQSYIKSILKSNIQDETHMACFDGPSDDKLSLNEVMESIIQQLLKNDNTESIDAYQTLASTIKAYDEVPEEAVLKNQLNSVTKQIRLHLSVVDRPDPQPSDINVVTSALKVLVILVWNPEFASLLNDDFRCFILERSVSVIAEHSAPKSVIIHYLHLLATQDFRQPLLASNSRAARLVEALKDLTEHVKGNSVVSERLLVYQRLLDQARPTMRSKSAHWVEHMLSAMASNVTDTRTKALALGRKACQVFQSTSSISGFVRLVLDLKRETGRTLGAMICRRLEKMVTDRDDALQVPQVWAVILLLSNSPAMRIDAWQSLKEWLMVIQRCFNGSDAALRLQANIAWNRLVYIVRPHEASDNLVAMLLKPIAAQLDKAAPDKASKASHAASVSTYCNLLYYSFRPVTSAPQYTRVWNEYIVKVMRSSFFEKSSANADIASRILMALFWDAKTNTKVWNENRAHDNRFVDPEELPTIDCKWVRTRCSPILEIFQVLFRYSSWGLSGGSDQAYVSKAWRCLLKAIREAGSKEIKMSVESRSAVISVLKFLTKLWRAEEAPNDLAIAHLSNDVLTSMSNAAIAELSITNALDIMEADPGTFSPCLFEVVFDRLQLGLQSGDKALPLMLKFFGIISRDLEWRYEHAANISLAENCASLTTVSHILSCMPKANLDHGLETLSGGLAVWLRDENRYMSSEKNIECHLSSSKSAEALKNFAHAYASALTLVSPLSIPTLDTCLAAAMASSHSTVVNASVQAWNKTFENMAGVEFGPQLKEVVKRMMPYVELHVPTSWIEDRDRQSVAPPPAYGTQFESARQTDTKPDLDPAAIEQADEPTITEQYTNGSEEIEENGARLHQQNAPATASKSCHDDSQLKFVPIESSPHQASAEESQYLTRRQKEVRDRQREDAAVTFPDFRSNPRPQSRQSEPRDCGFARKAATMPERPETPTLPDQNDVDAGPEPSPTPKSRFSREVSEVDIPSSPPTIPGAANRGGLDMDDVSSPMPDATEANDTHVQFGSPLKDPNTIPEPEQGNTEGMKSPIAAETGHVDDRDIAEDKPDEVPEEVSAEILESTHLLGNSPENDATTRKQNDGPDQQAPVSEQLPEDDLAQESCDDADYAKSPSSPSKQIAEPIIIPPHHSSSAFNTDELEELSASQLSHDLDWSTVFEGLDTPGTASKSPRPPVEAIAGPEGAGAAELPWQGHELPEERMNEQEVLDAEDQNDAPRSAQKKRKRLQSGYAEPRKRRKSSRSLSRSNSSQASFFKREDEEDLLDCIVVDTSSEYQGSSSPVRPTEEEPDEYTLSQSSLAAAATREDGSVQVLGRLAVEDDGRLRVVGGLRKRSGRRSKTDARVKGELIERQQTSSRQRQSRSSRSRSRRRMSIEASAEPCNQQLQNAPSTLVPVVEFIAPTSDAVPRPAEAEGPPAAHTASTQPLIPEPASLAQSDVVSSLQAVLEKMKTASADGVDVRAVDELCFQIRYYAQVAAMGNGSRS